MLETDPIKYSSLPYVLCFQLRVQRLQRRNFQHPCPRLEQRVLLDLPNHWLRPLPKIHQSSHLHLHRKDRPLPNVLRRPRLGVLLPKAVHTRKRRTRDGRSGYLRSRIHRQSVVYICCGIPDTMWQTTAYWLMSAMSNEPSKLAFFAGFYKLIHSVGAAGIWRAGASFF